MIIKTNLKNYYGSVFLVIDDTKNYLALENYDGYIGVEVSEDFKNAFINEFGSKKELVDLDLDYNQLES